MTEPGVAGTRARSSLVCWVIVACSLVVLASLILAASSLWARHRSQGRSDVDGVLWRQVASVEDPFSRSLYSPTVGTVTDLLDGLAGDRWDGSLDGADAVDLSQPTLLIYDVEADARTIALRVFVSSGERVDPPHEEPRMPWQPLAYFTCYSVMVTFAESSPPSVARVDEPACPSPLVSRMPSGAAYAEPSAFDG